MKHVIQIKRLSTVEEADLLDIEFAEQYPWYHRGDYYLNCLEENQEGKRVTLMAYCNDSIAGCCHLLYESKYPYFRDNQIPEINDLNVFPSYRRLKIASQLFDEFERIASQTSRYIGLGVGLYKDYGNAQRMYMSRGYIADGNGITYDNVPVIPGKPVVVDDELLIYLVKDLQS
ncbi:GNAT family N-acetyltransferase [Paenibacillus sp. D2_2]|uniref:GNAT family N-acetyltransferase n=1 Tax=Paenibacillus sp. D2_2 TaxID=3073092 RepID=UPI00281656DD|nr:GNAT family N-acetyltransferase [Paenibacillus sp. D2_2]WMT38901.1 GNAT family N-acetyltransferase [Paenibacillus sp. D2_2]